MKITFWGFIFAVLVPFATIGGLLWMLLIGVAPLTRQFTWALCSASEQLVSVREVFSTGDGTGVNVYHYCMDGVGNLTQVTQWDLLQIAAIVAGIIIALILVRIVILAWPKPTAL